MFILQEFSEGKFEVPAFFNNIEDAKNELLRRFRKTSDATKAEFEKVRFADFDSGLSDDFCSGYTEEVDWDGECLNRVYWEIQECPDIPQVKK